MCHMNAACVTCSYAGGEGKEEFSMLSVNSVWVETNTADSGNNCDLSLDRPAIQNVLFP